MQPWALWQQPLRRRHHQGSTVFVTERQEVCSLCQEQWWQGVRDYYRRSWTTPRFPQPARACGRPLLTDAAVLAKRLRQLPSTRYQQACWDLGEFADKDLATVDSVEDRALVCLVCSPYWSARLAMVHSSVRCAAS